MAKKRNARRSKTSLMPSAMTSRSRIRLLPVTIFSLCLLLVAKMYDVYESGNAFSQALLGRSAYAASEEPAEAEEDDEEVEAADAEEEEPVDAADALEESMPDDANDDGMIDADDRREFSDIELDILQSLAERREQLNELEEEIRMKESLLESTEIRLDQKISQIETLESTVRELLARYDQAEESQIKSLVKIYENMKPKEAARIFDEMQMPILLMVVDHMSERRAAPILAKMSPMKARDLTQELAEDRKLRSQHEQQLNKLAR